MEQAIGYRIDPISAFEMNSKGMRSPYAWPGIAKEPVVDTHAGITPSTSISPDQILNACLEVFGLQLSDIAVKSRKAELVHCRMTIYFFMRKLTIKSLKEIGKRSIPGVEKDHTTILYSCSAIQNMIDTKDSEYYPLIVQIALRLNCNLNTH